MKPTLNPVFVVIAGEAPNREYFVRLQIRNQGFKIGHSYLEGKDEEAAKSAEWLASMLRKALAAFVMGLIDGAAARLTAPEGTGCPTALERFHQAAVIFVREQVCAELNERLDCGKEEATSVELGDSA